MKRAPRFATDVVSDPLAAFFAGLVAAGFAATWAGLPAATLAGFPAGVGLPGFVVVLPGFAVAALATVVTTADFLIAEAVDDPVLTLANAGAGTAFAGVGFVALVTGTAGFVATVVGVTGFVATIVGAGGLA